MLRSFEDNLKPLRAGWTARFSRSERLSAILVAVCEVIFYFAALMFNGTVDVAHKIHFYVIGVPIAIFIALASTISIARIRLQGERVQHFYLYECLLAFDVFYLFFGLFISIVLNERPALSQTILLCFSLPIANWVIAAQAHRISMAAPEPETMASKLSRILVATGIGTTILNGLSLLPLFINDKLLMTALLLFVISSIVLIVFPAMTFRRIYSYLSPIGFALVVLFALSVTLYPGELLVLVVTQLLAFVVAILLMRIRPEADIRIIDRSAFSWLDIVVVILIFTMTLDINFTADRHHYNAFLGAVNDVLHGKTLLVDSMSQYGWLSILAIAAIPSSQLIPLSYSSFSLFMSLTTGVVIAFSYGLLRLTLKSVWGAILTTVVIVVAHVWRATEFITIYPSSSLLRYIWLYALVLIWGWQQYQPSIKSLQMLRHVTLMAGLAWSIDTAVYCLVLHLALSTFDILLDRQSIWRKAGRQLFYLCIDIGLVIAIIYVTTYLQAGQWPDWRSTVELEMYYLSQSPVYISTFFFYSAWLLIACVYLISLFIILLKLCLSLNQDIDPAQRIVFGITILGLLQFIYWVGNSWIITVQVVTAIMLVAYWSAEFLRRKFRSDLHQGTRFFQYFFGVYYLCVALYHIVFPTIFTPVHLVFQPIVSRLTGAAAWNLADEWNKRPSLAYIYPDLKLEDGSTVPPSIALINRFAPDKDRVVLLIPPDSQTETLIATGKANVYPLDHAIVDSLSPTASQQAVDFSPGLKPGEIIFIAQDFESMLPIQRMIIQKLCQQYSFEPLEISNGIAALRLDVPGRDGGCTCEVERLVCLAQ